MHRAMERGTQDTRAALGRLRAGSSDALAELYASHGDVVFRAAYRLLGTRDDAEDVLHDVFVALPDALKRYEERGSFDAWLRRLTVRTCLMRLRQQRRRNEAPLYEETAGASSATEETIVGRTALWRALARLSEAQRVVFILKEIEGYNHADIGALLGISKAASELRLIRAVTNLRRHLGVST